MALPFAVCGRAQDGLTPLHYAPNGHQECVRLLLERGADKDAKDNVQHAPTRTTAAARCV